MGHLKFFEERKTLKGTEKKITIIKSQETLRVVQYTALGKLSFIAVI